VSALPLSRPREAFVIAAPTDVCDRCHKPATCLFPRHSEWYCRSCHAAAPNNVHEHGRRVRKAFALAETLKGVPPELFNQMGEKEWKIAAKRAGVNLPSIEARYMVAYALEHAAQRKESHAA
jgi:hypothetical protein